MDSKNKAASDEHIKCNASKKSKESFEDVNERMTGKSSFLELAGILSKREVATIETYVKQIRNRRS